MTYNPKANQCLIFEVDTRFFCMYPLLSQHPYPNYGNVLSLQKENSESPKTWKKWVQNGDYMCILHFLQEKTQYI